jgi:hypothetical protein
MKNRNGEICIASSDWDEFLDNFKKYIYFDSEDGNKIYIDGNTIPRPIFMQMIHLVQDILELKYPAQDTIQPLNSVGNQTHYNEVKHFNACSEMTKDEKLKIGGTYILRRNGELVIKDIRNINVIRTYYI